MFGPWRTGLALHLTTYRVGPLSENPTLVLKSRELWREGEKSVVLVMVLQLRCRRFVTLDEFLSFSLPVGHTVEFYWFVRKCYVG